MLLLALVSVLALAFAPALTQAQTVQYTEIYDGNYTESSLNPAVNYYDYYKIWLSKPQSSQEIRELRISLTTDVGDAEMFVLNDMYPGSGLPPSNHSWVWRANDAGKAALFMNSDDCHRSSDIYRRRSIARL